MVVNKMELNTAGQLSAARFEKNMAPKSTKVGEALLLYIGEKSQKNLKKELKPYLSEWQITEIENSSAEYFQMAGKAHPVFVVRPKLMQPTGGNSAKKTGQQGGLLDRSLFAASRDLMGSQAQKFSSFKAINIYFSGAHSEEFYGGIVGLEMGLYRFKTCFAKPLKISISSSESSHKDLFERAKTLGISVNIARHLTNLPPNLLHPEAYANSIVDLFKGRKHVKTELWNVDKLRKEKMGLLLGVGEGAKSKPCLLRIKYRHPKVKTAPIALVGKGITFDTGGLDIKTSGGMRLMKKDMGGSAACVGVAFWGVESEVQQNFDVYLAIAENSISDVAFRPSDVLTARNGITVEIHNTDAEGRLVLADALDVAVTQKGEDEPRCVINVATLTGAIKASLGTGVAGVFSNDDELCEQLIKAGARAGDRSWRMPLVQEYLSQLQSPVADLANCSDGFGGAVIAALFLERFVQKKPWAHFDMYAWKDRPEGAWSETGGSGQTVLQLSRWLENL